MSIDSDKSIVNLSGVSFNLSAVSCNRADDDPGVLSIHELT